mmetsp:Transcript_4803/g.7255  ORF Transcript_4803/g.7255 Transcript_4803/m.7255 type:complete len:279 (+) Transcript_4803:111-947(+)|eukprot:CAMPEP_0203788040 /NCGR_PEP_ID=MMETSP0100_2-20121128/2605_1 /ASSEMBLY_ACC=CAM_ASM_000210 /TAXON_ID=96639 /ORGANISM=" , Strain NY0313808BC1" /LENGTH=278 /DNA_ID=CAMNT_0050690697 /DNA_START=76 /DNA_END=912 /DNA_ORIENTATION=+
MKRGFLFGGKKKAQSNGPAVSKADKATECPAEQPVTCEDEVNHGDCDEVMSDRTGQVPEECTGGTDSNGDKMEVDSETQATIGSPENTQDAKSEDVQAETESTEESIPVQKETNTEEEPRANEANATEDVNNPAQSRTVEFPNCTVGFVQSSDVNLDLAKLAEQFDYDYIPVEEDQPLVDTIGKALFRRNKRNLFIVSRAPRTLEEAKLVENLVDVGFVARVVDDSKPLAVTTELDSYFIAQDKLATVHVSEDMKGDFICDTIGVVLNNPGLDILEVS